jgi:SsrA-binding protein
MTKTAVKHVLPVSTNRKAYHDYFIHDTYEAGIALTGTEVKSIRQGRVNLRDSFVRLDGGEVWLWNAHISPYEQGNRFNHDPLRTRKLLLHKHEILKLQQAVSTKGYTLIPLKLYFRRGKVKCEIAVAQGKKLYDKRRSIAERDSKRDIERRLKEKRYD